MPPNPRRLEVPLAPDKRILLSSQGGYREHVRSGWRLGKLHLTDKRLLFSVQTGVVFETFLSDIHSIAVEKQRYVGGRIKDVIVVIHQSAASKRVGVACIIMADLATWRNKLSELTSPGIDEETIQVVLEELSPKGQAIVEYLWRKGHAPIADLAELTGAPSHMDVLLEIRDSIVPAALRVIGSPLLVFERAKVDESTGERVVFSWWMARRSTAQEKAAREPFVDIFDEGDHVDILLELVGAREEAILLGVGEDKLIVSSEGSDGKYREEILLPSGLCTERVSKTYRNNILLVRLDRLQKYEGIGPQGLREGR
ncbi:MAG: Hsp20/alpha crystallin family protein [Candidatus Binatia bacterium]